MVLEEGLLFRPNETAFVTVKRKLFNACNLYCMATLSGGVFAEASAGVKMNLLFFNKGELTKKIWYCDMFDLKVDKRQPFRLNKFDAFFRFLSGRADSERSWTIDVDRKI